MTRLPLVQLLEHEVGDLPGIAKYADAIGIAKALATAETVARAHDVGISVHVWTFRAENEFLPDDLKSGPDPGGARRSAGRNRALPSARYRWVLHRFSRRRRPGQGRDRRPFAVKRRGCAITFPPSTPCTSR